MHKKTATLIGATGLIGSHLLDLLRQDDYFSHIKVLVRRPLPLDDPKVEVLVVDFSNDASFKAAMQWAEVVFCSVGTTQKKVKGDSEAYRKVDYDIPVKAAQLCAVQQGAQFLLVSAVGANSKAGNFYLKLKGEVEQDVGKAGIPSVSIFRPSMLLGRRQEFRLGEKIGQLLMPTLSFLLPSRYRAIQAEDVAKAMLQASKHGKPGVTVYHYADMLQGEA